MALKIIVTKHTPLGLASDVIVDSQNPFDFSTTVVTASVPSIYDEQVNLDKLEVRQLTQEVRDAHAHIHDDVDAMTVLREETEALKEQAAASQVEAKKSEVAAKNSETASAGNAATTTADRAAVSEMRDDVETRQADVTAKANKVAADTATTAANTAAAEASMDAAKVSETKAKTSEVNAKASETKAKTSETNAKTSETKAKASETTSSNNAATTTEDRAAVLEMRDDVETRQADVTAKANQVSANTATTATNTAKAEAAMEAAELSEGKAKTSEVNAKSSETKAKTSETNAKASEGKAKTSETNAAASLATVVELEATTEANKNIAVTKAGEAATSASQALSHKNAAASSDASANDAESGAISAKEVALDAARRAEAAVAALSGAMFEAGAADLSSGTPPAPPLDNNGQKRSAFWKVIKGGTVAGVPYGIGDSIVYSVAIDDYYKIDNTESVTSVNGMQGVVVLNKSHVGLSNVPNYAISDIYTSTGTNFASRKALYDAYVALNNAKVNKAGDTMTGTLTLRNDAFALRMGGASLGSNHGGYAMWYAASDHDSTLNGWKWRSTKAGVGEEDKMYLGMDGNLHTKGQGKLFGSLNKPNWNDVGGNGYWHRNNSGVYNTSAVTWIQAGGSDNDGGYLPCASGTASGSKSFIGLAGWWFKESWVNSYRGGSVDVTGAVRASYLNNRAGNNMVRQGGSGNATVVGNTVEPTYIDTLDTIRVRKSGESAEGVIYTSFNRPTAVEVGALPVGGKAKSAENADKLEGRSPSEYFRQSRGTLATDFNLWPDAPLSGTYSHTVTGANRTALVARMTGTSTGTMVFSGSYQGELYYYSNADSNRWSQFKIYTSAFPPDKEEVGLGSVNNWSATSAVNDSSTSKYATAAAAKIAYDKGVEALNMANTKITKAQADGYYLAKAGKAADSGKLDGLDSTDFARSSHSHSAASINGVIDFGRI